MSRRLVRMRVDGVELAVETWGEGDPVVVLHGFTGSAAAMEPLTSRLDGFALVVPDLVGHGRSAVPTELTAYGVRAMAGHGLGIATALGHDTIHLVGYSMGGRVALTAACEAPHRVRSLTLIGATAGIADADERNRRRAEDEGRAARIDADLAGFVDEWMANPLFAGQATLGSSFLAAARAQRLAADPTGLANSLRGGGTGAMTPLHGSLSACSAPTMLIVGENDAKFCAIADDLAESLPSAGVERIRGAGHAAHLEQADITARAITSFIRSSTSS